MASPSPTPYSRNAVESGKKRFQRQSATSLHTVNVRRAIVRVYRDNRKTQEDPRVLLTPTLWKFSGLSLVVQPINCESLRGVRGGCVPLDCYGQQSKQDESPPIHGPTKHISCLRGGLHYCASPLWVTIYIRDIHGGYGYPF